MDDKIIDDDGPQVIVLETDGDAALWVRVGPVFYGGKTKIQGIWIEYQSLYLKSNLTGPFLMSIENWKKLNKVVNRRIRRHKWWKMMKK